MTISATNSGTFPLEARQAAELYLRKGLAPIPLPERAKDPGYEDWPNLRLTPDTIDAHFPPGQQRNLGILNGIPSGNSADVDLDVPEAICATPLLLPPTGWVFGHQSAPGSHWEYRTHQPMDTAQEKFTDLDGTVLVELRGTGGMTVFPPSTHKDTGEQIVWERFTEPGEVTLAELRRAVGEVAAVALLARHWPAKGTRQDAFLALVGGLLRAGWTQEHAERFAQALAAATQDEEAGKRIKTVMLTARKLEQDKKTTGWPKLSMLLGENGDTVISRVGGWLGVAAARVEDLPVPEPPPWPDPPAAEVFYGLPGKIVSTISPASEADPAALLVQALVAFGNAIGRSGYFTVESDRHYANEYAVLVGRTSKARKGTSWGRIIQLFREADEQWAAERVQSGASSGEGLIWAVRDAIMKRERVKEKGKPARYEEVEADPGVEDKRLLVFEPEFANVLKQTERHGNTLSVILRQAWDGSDLRSMTKNSPARATGAHTSLIGHITVAELHRYLTQTETANGYANRHLWVCTDRSKLLPEGGRVDPMAWERLQSELADALAFARSVGEMTRDDQARAIWLDVYGPLSEGKPGLAGALLARAEAHVMRLAMIYALMDRSAVIGAPHLLAALALWDYVERSVSFIFGDDLGDPVADELLRLLLSCPAGLTRNELRDYFGRHQSSERIGRALGLLLQHRLARCERQDTGGRPAERWFAVARAKGR
jgi:hypothetical protein